MKSQLEVSTEYLRGAALLRVKGELDLSNCEQLEAALKDAEKNGATTLVVDLGSLEFIDSTGLTCLIKANARETESGLGMWMIPGGDQVKRVFELSGMDEHLQLVDDVSEVPGLDG